MTRCLRIAAFFCAITTSLILAACSDSGSRTVPATAPSAAPNAFTSMKVGTAGNVTTALLPGETRQLWAVASTTDGATTDVTNVAIWQSSNPAIATVSADGVVKAAVEGTVSVSATYQKVSGSLEVGIEKAKPAPPITCAATLDKPRLVFNAFGGSTSVQVTLTKSDCRWTLAAPVPWLRLNTTPFVSGTGTFGYEVLDNNTPSPRSAQITIQVADGPATVHEVTQEKPVGCSYVVAPEKANFTSAGGAGSFDVIATPADCQWTLSYYDFYPVRVTNGLSGTGRKTVTYTVAPYTEGYDRTAPITVSGLSGANPPGVHTVSLARR
jgi:hypothetical protein